MLLSNIVLPIGTLWKSSYFSVAALFAPKPPPLIVALDPCDGVLLTLAIVGCPGGVLGLSLADGLRLAEGEIEALGLSDGDTDGLALRDALGLTDGLTDGETLADGLSEALGEGDTLALGLTEALGDGDTLALGESDGELA